MRCQCLFHLLIVQILPGRRDILLGRIGPPVTIVEVNHHCHPLRLGTKSHHEHILLAAKVVFGINPYPQTHGIQSEFLHQHGILALLALGIIEFPAPGFQCRCSTDIRTKPKSPSLLGITWQAEPSHHQKRQKMLHILFILHSATKIRKRSEKRKAKSEKLCKVIIISNS